MKKYDLDVKFPRPFLDEIQLERRQHPITKEIKYFLVAGDFLKVFNEHEEAIAYLEEQTKWEYVGTEIKKIK